METDAEANAGLLGKGRQDWQSQQRLGKVWKDLSFKASASILSCQHCDLLGLASRTSGEWGLASFQPTKFVIHFYSCPQEMNTSNFPQCLH